MSNVRKAKIAMLAATALTSAAAALAPTPAGAVDPVAYPVVIEAPATAHIQDHTDQTKPAALRLAAIAIAAGALAGLIRLFGLKTVIRAAKESAVAAAQISGKAAGAVAKVAGRSLRSPLRFLALVTGLVIFALTGLWLYDIEWLGGLAAGAGLAATAAYAVLKTRRIMAPKPVRVIE